MLNVDYVCSGSSQRRGNRLTVMVEPIQTRTARVVWAEAYNQAGDKTVIVLDDIGDQIVASIASEIEMVEQNSAILDHRAAYGVEPICKVLPIAPSTYHAHAAQRADPAKQSLRAKPDLALMADIQRVFDANFGVYGVRKVWRQLGREGKDVARCTVARLMRRIGVRGVVRGREVRTTVSNPARRISLAWRNSRFSRSGALILALSSVVGPPRGPCPARPAGPSSAASRPCSRSCPQSS